MEMSFFALPSKQGPVQGRFKPAHGSAERKRRGQALKGYMPRKPCATRISASVVKALLIMVIMQRRFSF